MLSTLVSRGGFVLRKVQGRFAGCAQYGLAGRNYVSRADVSSGSFVFGFLGALALAAFVIAMVIFRSHEHGMIAMAHTHSMLGLVGVAGITAKKSGTDDKKPANIKAMEKDLKSLLTELEQGQIEMSAGRITQERGEELEEKAQEAEELQAQIDRYNKIAGITKGLRQVGQVTLPGDAENIRSKSLYTTPGHLFVASPEFATFRKAGIMSGFSGKVDVGGRLGRKAVRLLGEAAVEFEKKAFDIANLPTLGTDAIIAVDRDPEIVRFEEPEILSIRDVLSVSPTTSDAVKYVRHTSVTRAAASQATRGAAKPYLKVAFDSATATVQTIAVLSKVTEQDISDAPRLVGYINGEMALDIKVEEERQLVWGDGTNASLIGLFDDSVGMPEFNRAAAGDTIVDTIRKMRTDLRKKRVQPTFVLIDPIDWEEVELTKGTDTHYIWGLVQTLRGPQIWSMRVVESDAMTNPDTAERRVCVGDGIRGATIYDRESVQLAVGFVDDDFARNLRTLRAEERLAFAVKRPWAFEFFVTEEAAS